MNSKIRDQTMKTLNSQIKEIEIIDKFLLANRAQALVKTVTETTRKEDTAINMWA